VAQNLKGFLPIEISNLLWAFATLGIQHEALFAQAARALEKPETHNKATLTALPMGSVPYAKLHPNSHRNMLWAFEVLGHAPPRLGVGNLEAKDDGHGAQPGGSKKPNISSNIDGGLAGLNVEQEGNFAAWQQAPPPLAKGGKIGQVRFSSTSGRDVSSNHRKSI
jgi:hypothetical protein